MGYLKLLAHRRRTLSRGVSVAGAAALSALGALLVTGCGGTGAAPDHGPVVAQLPIPFQPAVPAGKMTVVRVHVTAGQRFSIKVDTVDYPDFWTEAGAGPDAQVVQAAGDFPDGACPGQEVGCAIPYLYAFVARSRGTITMTWEYHQGHAGSPPSVTYVAIDIAVG
jgi:hypothetical protein